jgi:hypothetical protein
LPADRAQEALDDLAHFNIRRHAHTDFLSRAWELRENLTACDAIYVARRGPRRAVTRRAAWAPPTLGLIDGGPKPAHGHSITPSRSVREV